MHIGCMNSWKAEPTKYKKHNENCGKKILSKYVLGNPNNFEMREIKVFNVQITKLGSGYNKYTCKDCECTWTSDSSD